MLLIPLGVLGATRSLSLGLTGSDVTSLQNGLIDQGYLAKGYNTGYFGPLTEAAVKRFQCDKKVICSGGKADGYGVYGPKTRAALALELSFPKNPATLSDKLTPAAAGSFEVSGWIPYWRSATGTQDVLPHLNILTSVMPFVYTVKSDGTLVDNGKLSEEPWKTFIAVAKALKVRVVPTVMWGNGESIHRILSNTKTRIALEDEIANLVKQNDFDGIDIDFEAKERETINYFSTFLKGLYARMGQKWVYCTVEARMPLEHRYLPGETIPPDAVDYANDYISLNKYCDRVEIMAYDQGTIDVRLNAVRPPPYAPNADPEWVESLVRLAAQTISRNKLIVGIPTYGYEYAVTRLSDTSYQYKRLWPFNYRYATDIAAKLGIIPIRNNANEIGFAYDPQFLAALAPTGNDTTLLQQSIGASTTVTQNVSSSVNTALASFNYLSWSDAQAIKDKVDLAKKLGLRGVAIFKFDGGEDQGMWDILK
jgi:spore germination protein YaaH